MKHRHSPESIAIHEAGHAVAHQRFHIAQKLVSIAPQSAPGTLGKNAAEDLTWSHESAALQVQAYLAGYAALVGAGYSKGDAEFGARDDFDKAAMLIHFWQLGTLDEWKHETVELMSRPANVEAVRLVASELLQRQTLDGRTVGVLVAFADGELSEHDLETAMRTPGSPT